MNQLTPEQLKVIAEGMGYRAEISFNCIYVTKITESIDFNGSLSVLDTFNPYTNHSQLVEVIRWLLNAGCDIFKVANIYCVSLIGKIDVRDESFEHAILTAAWEVAKETMNANNN